jgi:hypothetical protein
MAAKITSPKNRSDRTDLGIDFIKGTSMSWVEIDIDDHVAAVIVFGETRKLADERARRLVRGWNSQPDDLDP